MNKLRLTNVIENHFYLDFNWKEEAAPASVSRKEGRRKERRRKERQRKERQRKEGQRSEGQRKDGADCRRRNKFVTFPNQSERNE